jgi:hypothetical protein
MITEEEIKKLAWLLWEAERRPDTKDTDHCSRAERMLEEKKRVESIMDKLAREMTVEPNRGL